MATSDDYTISDDPARLDLDAIHRHLSMESYWARGLPRETLERAVAGSLCFGVYHGETDWSASRGW